MARTYRAPRKFSINGKAGRVVPAKLFDIPEVDQAIHNVKAAKRLAKQRRKDRQWKLSAAAVIGRMM